MKQYPGAAGTVDALRGVDARVDAGEWVAIIGASGSGKTTLLNCLSGVDSIDAGEVRLDGVVLHELADAKRSRHRARWMGFVFQSYNLIPVLSAVENVELPMLIAGYGRKDARRRSRVALEAMGLGHREHESPRNLSGGEQQRVAIARAVAGEPAIVWADEPTAALDSVTAAEILGLFADAHSTGVTLIVVTHDPDVAARAQRTISMCDGEIVDDRQNSPASSP